MTKETIGYVQLEWTCPNCGSKNPGPQKTCGNCGAAQPGDVQFQQAAQEVLVSDEKQLASAKAGPDIHCGYCGARNAATAERCSQCGADLKEGAARQSGRIMGAYRDKAAPDVPCPSCGALNPATATECAKCGASMARPEPRLARQPALASGLNMKLIAAIGIAAVVLLCGAIVLLTTRTSEKVGRVQNVAWTRSITVEVLGPVEHEGWRDDLPSAAVLGDCRPKAHHTQPDPAPNSEKVCGTPYTVDTGSGFGEVVQDCEYEVYEDWCDYTVEEWQALDVLTLEGEDLAPRWPVAQLASGQREGKRQETYQCVFNVDGKILTYNARGLDEFNRCTIDSRWNLKVNTFNAIVAIEPVE